VVNHTFAADASSRAIHAITRAVLDVLIFPAVHRDLITPHIIRTKDGAMVQWLTFRLRETPFSNLVEKAFTEKREG